MIRAEGATLEYSDHGRPVFACRDIDLHVNEGEFLGILGPSGSGKSSLLYLLSGLKIPTAGDIFFNGENLSSMSDGERSKARLDNFGFVFQQPYLLGYLTAIENALIANPTEQNRSIAQGLLDTLGIGHKSHRMPHELSGGEKQRVCVARALMGSPKVIFADEPTASLDHTNGAAVVSLLNEHRGGGSMVMVTHDESMLWEADRIVRIVDGSFVTPASDPQLH